MQKKDISEIRGSRNQGDKSGFFFSSNGVRLSAGDWIIVGIIVGIVFSFGPGLWERIEKFELGPDYRLPYELSNDYRLYERYCRWACGRYDTLVVGDSVVWGHFVSRHDTLSHYLNEASGQERFANLGVDGIHPAALAGLVRYYGRDINGKNVILHFNPLWMSSKKHDLQTTKEFRFNHPKLVSQFTAKIPCYKDSYSKRIWAVVERYVSFFSWSSHLKIAYFENMDFPTWTLEHPYRNPLKAVTLELPDSENGDLQRSPQSGLDERVSWIEKGLTTKDIQWVELETSLQWRFFKDSVKLLKSRANNVFVLVGPFNEHMLKPESKDTYRKIKSEIEGWLRQNNVPYCVPEVLPSELYCDASHPLSEGYALLTKRLFENEFFRSSIFTSGRNFGSSGPGIAQKGKTDSDVPSATR